MPILYKQLEKKTWEEVADLVDDNGKHVNSQEILYAD